MNASNLLPNKILLKSFVVKHRFPTKAVPPPLADVKVLPKGGSSISRLKWRELR